MKLTSNAAELNTDLLTAVLRTRHPDAAVDGFDLIESRQYGEQMVSTTGRAILKLRYAAGSPAELPERVVCKLAVGPESVMAPFYENEVQIYDRLRPDSIIEAPRSLGASYDPDTGLFLLMLEDLSVRGARFPNVLQRVGPVAIASFIDTLAVLHAAHWNSPRFATDLAWIQTHVEGGVAIVLNELAPPMIQHEIDTQVFKNEMVQRLRTTGPELLSGVKKLQKHQAGLAQTVLHGDTHLGNTYLLPDGGAGLLDWQLSVRGHCMHDVGYLLATGLSIGERRGHERALLDRYREKLLELGVIGVPTREQLWSEYGRSMVWGVYIGWLTTPVVNYGWEINVVNHLRLITAYDDLHTAELVAELDA